MSESAAAGTTPVSDDHTHQVPIEAQVGVSFTGVTGGFVPEWIQYMPGGEHTITAKRAGRKTTVSVVVNAAGADRLQASLQAHLDAGRQRPFCDFDHEGKRASAWPVEFAWMEQPEPGIYARVEWSEAGRVAVAGKDYRAFSPTFFVTAGQPAEVDGAPMNMGALVNDPAFRDIAPLWARNASAADNANRQHHNKTMIDQNTKTELAALQARVAQLETENAELQAAADNPETQEALEAANAELETSRKRVIELQSEADARRKRDAEAAVQSAVSRGAIAAKDETTQNRWRDLIVADSSNAELLAKLPGKAAVTAGRITSGSRVGPQAPARAAVVQPDYMDALRAYQAARGNFRERGLIYRDSIDPLLNKGLVIPWARVREKIEAANTLGDLVGDIISQRTLALIVTKRPMLRDVVTDFSSEQASQNQTVTTRTVAIPTVNDFGTGAGETADTDYDVTLSNHKEVHYAFTSAEYLGTNRNLVAEHSEACAVAIGNHMVDAVAALITDAFTSETTGLPGTKDYSALTTAAKKLNEAGAPTFNRNAWIDSDFAEALENDEIVMEYVPSDRSEAYGNWRNIKGFRNIWEYPSLPSNSVNLIGFAFQQNALLIAARVADDVESLAGAGYPGNLQVVSDPVTGLAVLSDRFITTTARAINMRMDVLYGCARGVLACGHKFVSA